MPCGIIIFKHKLLTSICPISMLVRYGQMKGYLTDPYFSLTQMLNFSWQERKSFLEKFWFLNILFCRRSALASCRAWSSCLLLSSWCLSSESKLFSLSIQESCLCSSKGQSQVERRRVALTRYSMNIQQKFDYVDLDAGDRRGIRKGTGEAAWEVVPEAAQHQWYSGWLAGLLLLHWMATHPPLYCW